MAPNDTREDDLDDFMEKWRREQQKLERLLYGGKPPEELPEERDASD
jgi:hypothetical protein